MILSIQGTVYVYICSEIRLNLLVMKKYQFCLNLSLCLKLNSVVRYYFFKQHIGFLIQKNSNFETHVWNEFKIELHVREKILSPLSSYSKVPYSLHLSLRQKFGS